jgi:hypothetical protein
VATLPHLERKRKNILAGSTTSLLVIFNYDLTGWRKHGAENDVRESVNLASILCSGEDEARKYFVDLWQKVVDILSTPLAGKKIEAVADALLIRKRLFPRGPK